MTARNNKKIINHINFSLVFRCFFLPVGAIGCALVPPPTRISKTIENYANKKHDPCIRSWCYKIELRMFLLSISFSFHFILISFSGGKMSGQSRKVKGLIFDKSVGSNVLRH